MVILFSLTLSFLYRSITKFGFINQIKKLNRFVASFKRSRVLFKKAIEAKGKKKTINMDLNS